MPVDTGLTSRLDTLPSFMHMFHSVSGGQGALLWVSWCQYDCCRIVLLYQNGQLRSDIFMHSSPWLERSKFFKAVAEPLDTQIRLQEPLIPVWFHLLRCSQS